MMKLANKVIGNSLLFVLGVVLSASVHAQSGPPLATATLQLVNGTIQNQADFANSRVVSMLPIKPAIITKLPANLYNPSFGEISLGPSLHPTTYQVLLDRPPGVQPLLLIDTAQNGDFTQDKPLKWNPQQFRDREEKIETRYVADVTLPVNYGNKVEQLSIQIIVPALDPSNPNAAAEGNTLIYSPNYIRKGTITLHNVTYTIMLYDQRGTGDFRPDGSPIFSGIWFLIDVNHNGVIDSRGEAYDIAKPFNIAGHCYRVVVPNADGSRIEIYHSNTYVKEILPPPILNVGNIAPSFSATTSTGTKVNFPADYQGKYVLLYFWGSWCPHCGVQNPYMVQAYNRYHSQGLQILGVSTDVGNYAKNLPAYILKNGLVWPDICDGKGTGSPPFQLYDIPIVPYPLLVDGTTGKILADRDQLLGKNLATTLARIYNTKQ